MYECICIYMICNLHVYAQVQQPHTVCVCCMCPYRSRVHTYIGAHSQPMCPYRSRRHTYIDAYSQPDPRRSWRLIPWMVPFTAYSSIAGSCPGTGVLCSEIHLFATPIEQL